MRDALGLDKPLSVQYAIFLTNSVRGDFGRSLYYKKPVMGIIAQSLPRTIVVTVVAMLFSVDVVDPHRDPRRGQARHRLRLPGHADSALRSGHPGLLARVDAHPHVIGGVALVPKLRLRNPQHIVLPAMTLGAALMAIVTRLTRSGMLDVLGEDYIRTARAKGIGERLVVTRHAFKNMLIPLVTVLGLQLGHLLSGADVAETVFGWSGVGLVIVAAIGARDYPLVQAGVLFLSVIFVFTNLAVDLVYAYLDPRIRYTTWHRQVRGRHVITGSF